MSETKTKEELVRLGWLTELRRQEDRQCFSAWATGTNVCALGLLAEVGKMEVDDITPIDRVGALAGLTLHQARDVTNMNDSRCTFGEIAHRVASWFK